MKAHVIQFKAFDQLHTKVFISNTPEEIHAVLSNICNTYEPVSILEVMLVEFLSLETLNKFK